VAFALLIWTAKRWRFYSKTYSKWKYAISSPSAIKAKLVADLSMNDGALRSTFFFWPIFTIK
jgi:hypothetical protein